MADTPKAGQRLSREDLEQIAGAIKLRQHNFSEEPLELTVALVLGNIGDRYSPVTCVGGEWEGLKQDLPKGSGVPLCPEGHPLLQGFGLCLGWYTND